MTDGLCGPEVECAAEGCGHTAPERYLADGECLSCARGDEA